MDQLVSIGFGLLASVMVLSALAVVRTSNLVHAVMWLASALLATGGLYALLGASFLAGVQALLYVGGVVTLMIFGVTITRRHDGIVVVAESGDHVKGLVVAGTLFAMIALAARATPGLFDVPAAEALATPASAADLGKAILVEHVVAFEALSVLLLAAILGAIVIARRRDPGAPSPGFGLGERDGAEPGTGPIQRRSA